MCINWIENRKVPKPNIVNHATHEDIRFALEDAFGKTTPYMLPDYYYDIATLESFKEFLSYDKTDKYYYTGDDLDGGFDCDDYSAILYGNTSIPKWNRVPIGNCWLETPAHAVNIFVDENFTVWFVEPQNDEMYVAKSKTDWKPHIIWF